LGLGFIPGIEVTTNARVEVEGRSRLISVHMLAYLPDPSNPTLAAELVDTVGSREVRARKIVDRISEDFPISWDLVLELIEEGATIGRPAIADALVEMGVVLDRTEAFNGPLAKGGPYYVATDTTDTMRAIKLILEAGGVPIIAHPLGGLENNLNRGDLPEEHFEALIDAGLAGFEVYHREVPEAAREWLLMLAAKHDLIVTGSSDYHGMHGKPNRLGENTTSLEMLERITSMATGVAPQL
jgi:predicted metal-dependent phosphoesterase TrpH